MSDPLTLTKQAMTSPPDATPAFDVAGRIALVTGAARGIGRACALALARAGADVALGFRDVGAGATWPTPSAPLAAARCRCR
jgi:NAD(P)-dependent dehydrogenase (short-subunit alcohol dehydrogenase family)